MLRTVTAIASPGLSVFEAGIVCEVFGLDRREQGMPEIDFRFATVDGGAVPAERGLFEVRAEYDVRAADDADLVIVLPYQGPPGVAPAELTAALRAAVGRGARVMSVCTGAFVLADAGLLDGVPCTTHWAYTDLLRARAPKALVDPGVLYVDAGAVLTSAGSAAGVDLCLYLVRQEYGAQVANAVARRMVVPPHRDGGQAQYLEMPIPPHQVCGGVAAVLAWVPQHLDAEVTVDDLARVALMSPRTFARRFRAEVGASPHDWLTAQRVLHAQRLLESTDLPLEAVAQQAGFGSAALLRHHFTDRVRTTPQSYRRTFRASA